MAAAPFRISPERKLFIGLKLEPAMKRRLEQGPAPGRPTFKAGDPAHLDTVANAEDVVYIGRVVDAGVSAQQVVDLERNIRSIVRLTFPDERPTGAILLFPVEEEAAQPAAAVH